MNILSSGGEKTRVLSAKVLGLVAAALVAIALLLTVPLASLASARAEARAGGAVAIAGDGDCDVETNDAETNNVETNVDVEGGANQEIVVNGEDVEEEDSLGTEDAQTQDGGEDNGDQTQDGDQNNGDQVQDGDNGVQQAQDGDDNGNRVEARAGGAVAIAGENCSVETENNDTEDVVTENDDEIEDLTGQTDGETLDTSDLSTLLPGDQASSDELSSDENTTQENVSSFDGEFETNESNEGAEINEFVEGSGSRQRQLESLRLSDAGLPLPRRSELDEIGKVRRFDRKPGAAMTLSIRALGLYEAPVRNSSTGKAFDRGIIHVPDTAYPWDGEDQKNVFLAGHRLGSPGEKDSRLVFYHLDELEPGDQIVLKDRRGRAYEYRVRELFKVDHKKGAWVADTLVGRDLLTLQTYTLPNSEDRLVVRADRVEPNPARGNKRR